MATIIYMIEVDKQIRYVGSSKPEAFEKRQANHLAIKEWLQKIDRSRIKFTVIDECEDEKRFELEHFYWDLLKAEGWQLENKRDPINAWPLITSSESAQIGVETRRRNGTLSNGMRAMANKLNSDPVAKVNSIKKGIQTRQKNGTAGNGGKTSGRINLPKMAVAGNSLEAREKAISSRRERGNINKTGQANKGQRREKISEANRRRHEETVAIMNELLISDKKLASKIRMKMKELSCDVRTAFNVLIPE